MAMRQSEGGLPYWFVAGVHSFGPSPCDRQGWPAVYTTVSGNKNSYFVKVGNI